MDKIKLDPSVQKGKINRNIYGHFSEHLGRCIYNGMFVGKDSQIPNRNGMRTDVVEALKNIQVPVLRWPGGCFADEYHWQDGIGPQETRKRMVNTNWGYVVEDNSFGTHEFLELCSQIGCEPYITGNVGSGTVREMAEWVEYLNSDGDSTIVRQRWENGRKDPWNVKYWGVGNESWGCGGSMRAEKYADEYRRYQTYCRQYGYNRLFKIACGSGGDDYHWTEVLMREAGKMMDGLSLHHYSLTGKNWDDKGSATHFSLEQYYELLSNANRMEDLICGHSRIMDKYDPEKKVGLVVDEWGTWHQVEPGTNPGFLFQQNTMRDAMVAALTLDIFNHHCDRVVMANLAQTVNVLQSVILTDGDKMLLTPTYHVFDLYKAHQDAIAVECDVETRAIGTGKYRIAQISASASLKEERVTLTLTNLNPEESTEILLETWCRSIEGGRMLTGSMNAYNEFDNETVKIQTLPEAAYESVQTGFKLKLPPCCVLELTLKV